VWVINIENKGFTQTWGASSAAPYLAKTLRAKGVLLSQYYGTAHNSEGNYVAQISGQGPDPQMQADCQFFTNFHQVGTRAPQQAAGTGCVFGAHIQNLGTQLSAHGIGWKGYFQDMGTSCRHPAVGHRDTMQKAQVGDQYATRHNPFVYFHAIIDHPAYCKRHVVPLNVMTHDLAAVSTTPRLSYITPDLCSDGHDAPCVDGRPGGLASVNAFLKSYVPKILASPAFRRDGMLVITADESDGSRSDSTACCGETAVNTPRAGILGPGGGRIGALVISHRTTPGTHTAAAYNHYSLLGSLEDVFGVAHLGYAREPSVHRFGSDVYNR
jgi:hypothetical protein